MKNIFKNIFLLILGVVVLQGCDSGSEARWAVTPTSGWVEFRTAGTTTGQTSPLVTVPIDIKVPVYPNGFNISYEITAAEGDFTQFVNQTGGTLFVDPEITEPTRIADLEIPLANMEVGRDFVTSFDITITSTSSGIGVGIDDTSITTHRVTIPCSNPEVIPDDYFVGDYTIEDAAATIGPANGTSNVASGTVTLVAGPDNTRSFSIPILPAFLPDPVDFTIQFTTDNIVLLQNSINTPLSCNGGASFYNWGPSTQGNPWDICNDSGITVFYSEDIAGSCGGPFTSSFILTKVN
jgi:hypothetical protein